MEGLTLKSRLSDVDLPCEIPAAITEPEWIIGPSWEHKAISTQRPCLGLGVPTKTETQTQEGPVSLILLLPFPQLILLPQTESHRTP